MVNPSPRTRSSPRPGARPRRVAQPQPARAGRAYGGVTPGERVAARRARLIQAGLALFGRQGLRATTVRGVCAEAGLTDRYFYESFDSLEALLAAVYQALVAQLHQRLDARAAALAAGAGGLAAVDLATRFAAGYEAWFDFVRDPCQARILLAEVLGVSPAIDALHEAGMQGFAERVARPLAEAGVPAAERRLLGAALVGAAVQVARLWVAGGCRTPRRTVVRTCVQVAVGALRVRAGRAGV